jgi:hypothetical protein
LNLEIRELEKIGEQRKRKEGRTVQRSGAEESSREERSGKENLRLQE